MKKYTFQILAMIFLASGIVYAQGNLGPSGDIYGVTATAPLSGGGTSGTVSVGLTACGTNQIYKWNGSAWACAADVDTDTNTTYTASSGVLLTGTNFTANLGGATCAAGTQVSAISASGAGTCSADVTAVANGTGISTSTVSGTATITANLAGASCTAGNFVSAIGATGTGTCTGEVGDISGVTANAPLSGGGTTGAVSVGLTACSTSQIYKYNGSAWVCASDDGGDVTQNITGSTGAVNALAVGATTTILYWTQSGTVSLNGIANGAAGRRFKMVLNSTQLVGLQVENAGATATDRIMAPGGFDQTFQGPVIIEWAYDTANNRWTYGPVSRYMAVLNVATTGTFGTGATITSGGLTITAGGLSVVSGNATIQQSLTVNDNTVLGNSAGDLISIVGEGAIIDGSGKLSTKSAGAITLSAGCGTGATFSGDRTSAWVQMGTGASNCTVLFTNAFTNNPTCVVDTDSATKTFNKAAVTTQLAIASVQSSTRYSYICMDHY